MFKRVFITALVALAVLGGIFGFKALAARKAAAAAKSRPVALVTVAATAAKTETWTDSLFAVGTLTSFRGIAVKSEIEGVVRSVAVESGATVATGAALLEIDDSVEQARLQGLEAQARLAESNLTRARELRANNTNAPADVDASEALRAQMLANVAELRATIAKKHLVAPFAGRLGIVHVHVGQFLNKGDTIALLESVNPIHVDFALPQQDAAHVTPGLGVRVTLDAFPGRIAEGKITAIEPRLSEATRSLELRATLANDDESLRPGMFARVEVVQPTQQTVVVVPTLAVVSNPYGDFVYVLEPGSEPSGAPIARQRFITSGPRRGDFIALLKGVKTGEQVVIAGQLKLRPGVGVKIDNSVLPATSATPKPNES